MAPKIQVSLREINPSTVEVELRSDRLGLSGRVDRVVSRGAEDGSNHLRIPSILRVDLPPEAGVWRSDRLRLAGYSMLLEEELEARIARGLAGYLRSDESLGVGHLPAVLPIALQFW